MMTGLEWGMDKEELGTLTCAQLHVDWDVQRKCAWIHVYAQTHTSGYFVREYMKPLERLFLAYLNKQVKTFQDPLQFAYCPGVGIEDAITYLLQWAHPYLDKAGSTVTIVFFLNFYFGFNTIQPALLCKKLQKVLPPQPPGLLFT